MKVYIPSPLISYTKNKREVQASGATLGDVLADLDRQFPGMRFRMINEQDGVREHIRFFVDCELVNDLRAPIRPGADLQIICAISGGVNGESHHVQSSNS